MRIGKGHVIRDASGRYACPQCWRTKGGEVKPPADHCPACGVELEWDL